MLELCKITAARGNMASCKGADAASSCALKLRCPEYVVLVWLRTIFLDAVGFGGDDATSEAKQKNAKASQGYEQKCERVIAKKMACEPC